MFSFNERILRLAEALDRSGVPYAFGGAIAYVLHTEPRATKDIDINVFVPETQSAHVLEALANMGIRFDGEHTRARIERDGQVRLLWDEIYVDLFFMTVPFLESAGRRSILVPFLERQIPILSAEDIAICKVAFNREKDWLDLRELVHMHGPRLDRAYLRHWLIDLLGEDSRGLLRFEQLFDEA